MYEAWYVARGGREGKQVGQSKQLVLQHSVVVGASICLAMLV